MEESQFMPKPMIPINGKPMIFYIMEHYMAYGHSDFVILGGTKIEYIIKYFENNYKKVDTEKNIFLINNQTQVQILDTGEETMTGGRVKRAIEELELNVFMLTYGDGFCDVNINLVIDRFNQTKSIGTVTAVRPPARFGSLDIAGEYVKNFGEKNQSKEGWINGGFFVFNSNIAKYIESDSMPLEKTPLETISKLNQLSVYKHHGFFQPVDTIREKEILEKYLNEQHR